MMDGPQFHRVIAREYRSRRVRFDGRVDRGVRISGARLLVKTVDVENAEERHGRLRSESCQAFNIAQP
jgi:hypothetical protein